MGYQEQYSDIEGGLVVRAPAKINLSLLVGPKREDGFHEIHTIMSKITWYDELLFAPSDETGVELVCKGQYWAPEGNDNLVHRACRLLLDASKLKGVISASVGIKVTLTKNIPAGTGLGGASSDAASALLGLNRYLDLGFTTDELAAFASQLGSDVPFFLYGPMALCTGRGEIITKIPENFSFRALVVTPNISIATKGVYENYVPDVAKYESLKTQINTCIKKKNIDLIPRMCANMLTTSCYGLYKEVELLESAIKTLGMGHVCLSGSGSALYCLAGDLSDTNVKHYQLMLREKFNCESLLVNNNRW